MNADPVLTGEAQARRRAGPWPVSGTLETFAIAADRAAREARRTSDIEYRWNTRFRVWERFGDPLIDGQLVRLATRRRVAITIANERERLLRSLLAPQGLA